MRFLSLFSGIEAASVAWLPLGWECVGVAEIEPFPCKVLAHHYPDVPNLGDITKITQEQIEALGHIDLVVGGFPCQDLSVAGKRKGFTNDDGSTTRSGLFYTAHQIAKWTKARWLLLENVPGIYSSNNGQDFASMVGNILNTEFAVPKNGWQNSGVAASATGLLEWRTLDAQHFGVPQRRRRMFALADFGNWTDRPPVLFERHSLQGHPAPSRKARQEVTEIAGICFEQRSPDGCARVSGDVVPTLNTMSGGQREPCVMTFDRQAQSEYGTDSIASSVMARDYKSPSDLVTYALAENTIGRQPHNGGNGDGFSEDLSYTLNATGVHGVVHPLASNMYFCHPCGEFFEDKHAGGVGGLSPAECPLCGEEKAIDKAEDVPQFSGGMHAAAHKITIPINTMTMMGRPSDDINPRMGLGIGEPGQPQNTLTKAHSHAVFHNMAVRRLTPVECERLQGFPDDYTRISEKTPDGPRYKALGNSMAVPVMRWIGERIEMVNKLKIKKAS